MSVVKDQRAPKSARAGSIGRGQFGRAAATVLPSPVAQPFAPDLDAARARLACLPTGFTDHVVEAPPWPIDLPEVIGPRP